MKVLHQGVLSCQSEVIRTHKYYCRRFEQWWNQEKHSGKLRSILVFQARKWCVNCLSEKGERTQKLQQVLCRAPKDVPGRRGSLRISEKRQSWNDCEWKINCCGIFCNWQEGSEATSKIPDYSYESKSLSGICNVPFLWSITQWLL